MKYEKQDLLLSIHVEYALSIIRGQKTVELRRKFPLFTEKDRKKIFIYACSPVSQIIGECDLRTVKKFPIKNLWETVGKQAMVDWILFQKYFKDCDFGFALYLKNPVRYNKNIELKKVFSQGSAHPPQSYRYIDRLEERWLNHSRII